MQLNPEDLKVTSFAMQDAQYKVAGGESYPDVCTCIDYCGPDNTWSGPQQHRRYGR